MQTVHSIEEIQRLLPTLERPVDVSCSDLQNYICKYRQPENLLKEYLASCFLQRWHVPTPRIAFVQVRPEHVPAWLGTQASHFRKPCFGSLYDGASIEVSRVLNVFSDEPDEVRRIQDRADLLRIGLFDLWLANEDRRQSHYNLLLTSVAVGKFRLCAIDHAACFNNDAIGTAQPRPLTEQDTILTSDLCRMLYRRSTALLRDCDSVLGRFEADVGQCAADLPEILGFVPPQWGTDTHGVAQALFSGVFRQGWINEVKKNFREYLQAAFR